MSNVMESFRIGILTAVMAVILAGALVIYIIRCVWIFIDEIWLRRPLWICSTCNRVFTDGGRRVRMTRLGTRRGHGMCRSCAEAARLPLPPLGLRGETTYDVLRDIALCVLFGIFIYLIALL